MSYGLGERPREVYGTKWIQSLLPYRTFNETAILAVFAHLGRPRSFVDFGCGDAWMVRCARALGCKPSLGVELTEEAVAYADKWAKVFVHDLRKPVQLGETFDMVISFEVAEHLPEESADTFVETLTSHASNWLVFTAAAPGQGGHEHINCQPQEYWREKIEAKGMLYCKDDTDRLRETWRWTTGPMFWLPQNLQVFKRVEQMPS